MELLFYAYRDFTAEADEVLMTYGFGRAHHRVIYFVGRNPGLPVSALLDILKITKQSLSRVLGQLIRQGFVQQRPGPDRRQRLLDLTAQGAELERRLTEDQRALVARAYRAAGADAVEGFRKVLFGLINEQDRPKVARSVLPVARG
jgi:DNA-binding MarR family transcriptional regulator